MNTPAFPSQEWIDDESPATRNPVFHAGMTLRDYFAAKAMQGMLCHKYPFDNPEQAAEWSYQFADAMLKARES